MGADERYWSQHRLSMSRDSDYLADVVLSARLILAYVEGVGQEQFFQDTKLQDSVIRRLEIIGEAAGRVSPEFRATHPEVPWGSMIGMRNRMIHGYDDIDLGVVWNTSRESVPNLLALIEPLAPLDPQ